jgi:aryl-alcohol dehydrogenase-like predicted oxidoreductase
MKKITLKSGAEFPDVIRGVWQLSQGHRSDLDSLELVAPIRDAVECGFNTFDCADIYRGAEELLGSARESCAGQVLRFHTKYVPDLDQLHDIRPEYTESIIDRSLKRLRVECLDLVQFHWWDYSQPYYLQALEQLMELKRKGKISAIGVTNFDSQHLEEILRAGIEVETIQLQASLLDKRSQQSLSGVAQTHQVKRLAYGTLLGGFLSAKWLGQPEPTSDALSNRSLVKYQLMIQDWGGWERFQGLLRDLDSLARKYEVSLSQIVVQATLQAGLADALIIGLSPVHFGAQNRELTREVQLTPEELNQLLSWECLLEGDVYELERGGKHAKIMRYHLNRNE